MCPLKTQAHIGSRSQPRHTHIAVDIFCLFQGALEASGKVSLERQCRRETEAQENSIWDTQCGRFGGQPEGGVASWDPGPKVMPAFTPMLTNRWEPWPEIPQRNGWKEIKGIGHLAKNYKNQAKGKKETKISKHTQSISSDQNCSVIILRPPGPASAESRVWFLSLSEGKQLKHIRRFQKAAGLNNCFQWSFDFCLAAEPSHPAALSRQLMASIFSSGCSAVLQADRG